MANGLRRGVEPYGGEWVADAFKAKGVEYLVSERTKNEIYRESLPLINSRRIELLDLPRLTSQLAGLERRTARGGKDSIDHAPGAHDDIANAACGALVLASGIGSGDFDIDEFCRAWLPNGYAGPSAVSVRTFTRGGQTFTI